MVAPLDGIRVIDWTQWQMGTVATAMLAELGAEVIHVENRITGDHGRGYRIADCKELPEGKSAYFETVNRGKKGLALDLTTLEGKEIIYRLATKSEVFVHNFRQGVPEKLKMDYDTIIKYNPEIIYAACSGFGHKGPEAKEPAFDMVGLARSGISSTLARQEDPGLPFGGGIADQTGAIFTAIGVLAAIVAKQKYGIGQKVDVSHLGSMMALQGLGIGMGLYLWPDGRPDPVPAKVTRKTAGNPLWNYYKCKDGKWICLGMLQPDVKWSVVCKALGIEQLENDPRYLDQNVRRTNSPTLIAVMDEIFLSKTCAEWMHHLKATGDIICTPVQDQFDLRTDAQVLANDYMIECEHETLGKIKVRGLPFELSKTPGKVKPEAPELGQHTEEIMLDVCGYTWEEIGELKEKQVI